MIRFDRMEDFILPEAYVYVCSATKSAPVFLTPIYHLGKHRLKKLVILCGVEDPEEPKSSELTEALLPAQRLRDFAVSKLGLVNGTDILIVYNSADDFAGWEKAAQAATGFAADAGDIPILANLTSGTKQMSHGIDHYLTLLDANWMRLMIGKRPATASLIVPVGNGLKPYWFESENEISAQPPFDVLISAMGVDVIETDLLRKKRKYYAQGSKQSAALFKALKTEDGWEALHAINVANSANGESKKPLILSQKLTDIGKQSRKFKGDGHKALQNCEMIYAPAVGHDFWADGHFEQGKKRAFLTGGWLEQYVLDQVSEAVRIKRHFVVRSQVELGITGKPETVHEIDVLLQQDAMFHLIEVKSNTSPAKFFDYAQKLAAINRAIAGRPAQSWIVAPFVRFPSDIERDAAIERCNLLYQVRLLTGPDAIDALLMDIEKLD